MTTPPRAASASIFTRRFTTTLALATTSLVATTLTVGTLVDDGTDLQRSAIFLTLGLGQLAVAWGIRAKPQARRGTRTLETALAGAATLLVLGTLLPPLQTLLGTQTPTGSVLAMAVLAAAVPGALVRVATGIERGHATTSATLDGPPS
jgi:Ca2+-transporting ATPase